MKTTLTMTDGSTHYCSYCGKKVKINRDGQGICDCEDAKKELEIKEKISALTNDYISKREALEKELPKKKYKLKLMPVME